MIFALFIVVISLSACADAPGIEDSSLPSDFALRKAIENGEIEYPEGEKFEIPTSTAVYPSGNYILLTHQYGANEFILSFYKEGKKVCHWENPITNPLLFEEKEQIYITEQNCSGMGDYLVIWDLSQNIATLNGDIISVWSSVGSQYFLLE